MYTIIRELEEYNSDSYNVQFAEILFKYYKMNNYSRNFIFKVGRFIDIKPGKLFEYIEKYANEELKMDKIAFDDYVKNETKKNKDIYLKYGNFILKEKGIITNLLWNNDDEKKYVLETIYTYSKNNNFSPESTKEISEKFGIPQSKYLSFVELYIKEYLNPNKNNDLCEKIELLKTDRVRSNNTRLRNCYNLILSSNNNEEIDNIIGDSGYSITNVKDNFHLYSKFYSEDEIKLFEEKIKKYKMYREEKKQHTKEIKREEKEQEQLKLILDESRKFVNLYLDEDNISFISFLSKYEITKQTFEEYVSSVREFDIDLYNKYKNIKDKKDENTMLTNEIKTIGNGLVNGYDIDDKHRNFDILDYFSITNIPLANILFLSSKILSKKELYLLKTFRLANKDSHRYNSLDEKNILSEKRIIGVQFDKNGQIIEGTGRMITDEEKKQLLSYLNQNNISINRKTYNAVLKRYLNGFLTFEDEKKLGLNKN